MRTRPLALVLLIALTTGFSARWLAAGQAADGGAERVAPEQVLAELSWLAGSWSGDMWGGRFEAYYCTPEGGKILSHSRLLKGEVEAFFELEVFEARGDLVHLQPFPGGKRVEGFTLETHDRDERTAVFENPDRDFPTRITYRRVSEDQLLIELSDPHGGSDQIERFELERTP